MPISISLAIRLRRDASHTPASCIEARYREAVMAWQIAPCPPSCARRSAQYFGLRWRSYCQRDAIRAGRCHRRRPLRCHSGPRYDRSHAQEAAFSSRHCYRKITAISTLHLQHDAALITRPAPRGAHFSADMLCCYEFPVGAIDTMAILAMTLRLCAKSMSTHYPRLPCKNLIFQLHEKWPLHTPDRPMKPFVSRRCAFSLKRMYSNMRQHAMTSASQRHRLERRCRH